MSPNFRTTPTQQAPSQNTLFFPINPDFSTGDQLFVSNCFLITEHRNQSEFDGSRNEREWEEKRRRKKPVGALKLPFVVNKLKSRSNTNWQPVWDAFQSEEFQSHQKWIDFHSPIILMPNPRRPRLITAFASIWLKREVLFRRFMQKISRDTSNKIH